MKRLRVLVEKESAEEVEQWLRAHGARNLQSGMDDAGDFFWYYFDGKKSPGRKEKVSKARILELHNSGMSYKGIAEAVACTKGYVQHVVQAAKEGNG